MLAATINLDRVKFPLFVSPKIDGIRCLIEDGKARSRTGKLLPNVHLQRIARVLPHGLDCEVTVGEPNEPNVMQDTSSGIMSIYGEPDFQFHMIDIWDMPGFAADKRHNRLYMLENSHPALRRVHQNAVFNMSELRRALKNYLVKGYEGLMAKGIDSRYKYGRSTVNEGSLLKWKEFEDTEAIVTGFNELMHNDNPAFEGELGQTKRQTLQENMVGMDTLGSLVCKSPKWLVPFSIGTGFDRANRDHIWENRESYLGKQVQFKYFPSGSKEAPRFPVFLRWRDHE
jgi:DNA ligase-1